MENYTKESEYRSGEWNLTGKQILDREWRDLEKDLEERKKTDKIPPANIVVAGITGTGKSTLINAIFGSQMAKTGSGRPITSQINEYYDGDIPIHIWDTVGLELDDKKTKESIKNIRSTIADKTSKKDKYDRIHAIWYCINSASNRYQGAELDFIKELYSLGVPFIIVLTQCSGAEEEVDAFENEIKRINRSMGLDKIEIVQVLAKPVKFRGMTQEISPFGLNELVDLTLRLLPEFIKSSFIASQKISQSEKRNECEKIICEYVRAAEKGFWDKIPLINVFTTDDKIIKMYKKLALMYNTVLTDVEIQKVVERSNVDFENNFFGLISPIDMGYSKEITKLLNAKKKEGFSVEVFDVSKSDRAARMIAYYGYIFIDSIEELWKNSTQEVLRDVEKTMEKLIEIINEKLKERKGRGNKK